MGQVGRPTAQIVLSDDERETWSGGRVARRPVRRWRCGVGSCWPPRRGSRMSRSPGMLSCNAGRSPNVATITADDGSMQWSTRSMAAKSG